MPYFLGVDLGTTYTAAAIYRDGRTSTVDLGVRTSAIPSVVFLRDDETILTGEAASRRGVGDPGRVAREFKRRVGDTTPILLGGSPYSADGLMSQLLRWVVDAVTEREGERPAGVAVAFPANWGPYKQELLRQSISRADLDHVVTITEPEAAVMYYASQERVEPGSVIAVYDLGGGTFDAAVVRKTPDGVELLGTPEGIERLGGVDFDEAVFAHVASALGGALNQLDPDDPAAMAAVLRLRSECVEAKEALSADTEASIPVLLPNVSTEVRLTRAELEAMIRPPLADSLTAMRRALRSAGVEAAGLTAVLLAGGSSRIPLVAQLVSAELGRPVAVDAHPKHGVALGAAQAAAAAAGHVAVATACRWRATTGDDGSVADRARGRCRGRRRRGVGPADAAAHCRRATDRAGADRGRPDHLRGDQHRSDRSVRPARWIGRLRARWRASARWTRRRAGASPPPDGPTTYRPSDGGGRRRSRVGPIIAGVLVVAAIAALAVVFITRGDDDDGDAQGAGGSSTTAGGESATTAATDSTGGAATTAPTGATSATTATTDEVDETTTTEPEGDPVCPDDDPSLCIEMTGIETFGDAIVVDWTAFNFQPAVDDHHAHFFWDTTAPEEAGTNAADFGATPGLWELTDAQPFVSEDVMLLSARPDDATAVCVTVATAQHALVDPEVFQCMPLPDIGG